MTRAHILLGASMCAAARAQAGPWALPLCFVWPGVDNERCEAFLGVGFGTCESGYEATWMGVCEEEHEDDDHDHLFDFEDHMHFFDFGHDDKPPPPSPAPPT